MSANRLRLIDCDSHVGEPIDLFEGEYMEAAYRGASPFRFVDTTDEAGRPTTLLYRGDQLILRDAALTVGAGIPAEEVAKGLRYVEGNPGGWDPSKRVADMDSDGIDHQVVYPSMPGQHVSFIEDPALAAAHCRAYNDWVADHCDGGSGRLSGLMVLPWMDVDLAVQEVERASKRDVLRGALMRPAPQFPNGFLGDPVFDPVYRALAERDLPLVFHTCALEEGLVGGIASHYLERKPWWHAATYVMTFGFPFEALMALDQLVFEGVLDRHPTLKVMFTESHGGWFVTALERMDKYARQSDVLRTVYEMRLELLPSEYFARQCFVVFEGDESALGFGAEHLSRSMVWAADYYHADATFPGAAAELRESLEGLDDRVARAIAWDNGARAFNLTS